EGAAVRLRHRQQVPVQALQRLLDARQRLPRAPAHRRPARPDPAPLLAARHRRGRADRPAGHRLPADEAVRDLAAAGDGRRPDRRHPRRIRRAAARLRRRGPLPRPGLDRDGQQAGGHGCQVADRGPAAGLRPRPGGDRDRRRPFPRPEHPDRPAELPAPARSVSGPRSPSRRRASVPAMVEFTVASAESTGFMNNDNGAAPAGSPDWGLGTKAIHAGQAPDPSTGAVMPPIYATSTYAQASPGVHQGFEYSRTHNPTRFAYERCVAGLEGGSRGFAFASGMAATATALELLDSGD